MALLALLVLLALAFWLRWQYVTTISLYVDEFTTLWAAERVLDSGVPIMPSGVLYTRGLLATYVTALAGLLAGGLSYTVGRLPSVLFGLATIAAIFGVGRREWNSRVGVLAALGLALLPEAIVWSGRARFYAQLQFFVLLALWAAYAAIQVRVEDKEERHRVSGRNSVSDPPSARRHLIFALLFTLAVFSQEQTVLLYPPVVLATLLWRPWRYLLRPQVWPAHLLCLAALAVRFAVEIVGQPGYFETIQAERPYVGLILDLPAAWFAYAPLLLGPERLPWTLFGLLGLAVAMLALWQARGRMAQVAPYHQATIFFSLQFVFVLVFILLFVGGQWRESRYLFLVQPLWLLTGAAGAVWAIDWLGARLRKSQDAPPGWQWSATAALALLAAFSLWQPAQGVLSRQVEGYDRVLAYVAAARAPGDVTMSPQPPACAFVLGPCDYYAVQRVYEEFVVPRGLVAGGELVDRWSGATLLDDAGQLAQVIRAAPAAWLIADRFRLATRYDEPFLRTVIEQFDIAFEERGVLALRAQGWREGRPLIDETLSAPLVAGPLTLTRWAHSAAVAGEEMDVTLTWHANAPIDRQINTSLRLVDAAGTVLAQKDGPPAAGIIPTNLFFDTPLPDIKTLSLPAELRPGEYQVQVVAYEVETVTPVGEPLAVGSVTVGE